MFLLKRQDDFHSFEAVWEPTERRLPCIPWLIFIPWLVPISNMAKGPEAGPGSWAGEGLRRKRERERRGKSRDGGLMIPSLNLTGTLSERTKCLVWWISHLTGAAVSSMFLRDGREAAHTDSRALRQQRWMGSPWELQERWRPRRSSDIRGTVLE